MSSLMPSLRIRILGKPSPTIALVEWADSTSARYGEQTWRLVKARRKGLCAISAARIKVGDAVYAPTGYPPAPTNQNEMILAPALESAREDALDHLTDYLK